MRRAGFVLAGGHSSRMGRDKALLPYGTGTLLEFIAARVRNVAGSAAVIGDSTKYDSFGYPVYADRVPGCGPISGLQTLLGLALADWNLMLACDLPQVPESVLSALMELAESLPDPRRACVVPVIGEARLQPLCAVYHASCLPIVNRALIDKQFKMINLLEKLRVCTSPQADALAFRNINTPQDWASL